MPDFSSSSTFSVVPPSITLVPWICSKLIGGLPFSVLKNLFTSAIVAPGVIGSAMMWCGSAPTFSNAIWFFPAFRPLASKLYSLALTVAGARRQLAARRGCPTPRSA